MMCIKKGMFQTKCFICQGRKETGEVQNLSSQLPLEEKGNDAKTVDITYKAKTSYKKYMTLPD